MAWTPWGNIDLIPGINIGNAIRQPFSKKDEDIFDGWTISGRKNQVQWDTPISDRANAPKANARPTGQQTQVPQIQNIADTFVGGDGTTYGTGGGGAYSSAPSAEDLAMLQTLRDESRGLGGQLNSIYEAMFGDLDKLVKSRSKQVESDYAKQFEQTAQQYADSIPTIENSYAALGAANSTDTSDAKDTAKEGFDDTTATIGKNKEKDLSAIGQYSKEQRAQIEADKQAVSRNLGRLDETDDIDSLRGLRNDMESNLGSARVTRSKLGTDEGARGELAKIGADKGRFEAATTALDNIIKSSMSGATKQAAVKSIVDNAGLSDEEKEKVNLQYGNVYEEQQAI